MITRYFTLGQVHTHSCNGHTLDKNCLIKITAESPREVMAEHFGLKWCFEYDKMPDMRYFSRGVYNLTENKWEK